jgi:hypothetical protein
VLSIRRQDTEAWRYALESNGDFSLLEETTLNGEVMRFTTGGALAIGTSAPTGQLDVQDNTGSLTATQDITAEFQRADGTYNPRLQIRHSTVGTDINHTYSTTADNLTFSRAGTEKMRITSSGVTVTGTLTATSFSGDGSGLTGVGGGLGVDQSWTNVTSSRAESTNYTNSTGKPILVNVYSTQGSAGSADVTYMDATVDGTTFRFAYHIQDDENYTARSRCVGNFIVPTGSTYSVLVSGAGISQWYELR